MKLKPSQIKKIAIFRALQLGDMLCSIPAIRAVRKAYPDAEITLIGLPWAEGFIERFNYYFDRFLCFPGFPGLPEQPFNAGKFADFLTSAVTEKFDLVFQMQGNGNLVNPIIELLGANYTAGFCKEGNYIPENGLFIQYPESCHEIERHLKLIQYLEIEPQGIELEFPLGEKDYEDFSKANLSLEEGKYVCIHPGSRSLERRLPAEYFARLGDLVSQNGLTAVITGTFDELETVNKVVAAMTHQPVIAAGKTSIGAVAVLIKKAAGLISNCTGVSHIAAALKIPSVVISLNGEPQRWDPMDKDLHFSIDWTRSQDFNTVYNQTMNLIERQSKLAPLQNQ